MIMPSPRGPFPRDGLPLPPAGGLFKTVTHPALARFLCERKGGLLCRCAVSCHRERSEAISPLLTRIAFRRQARDRPCAGKVRVREEGEIASLACRPPRDDRDSATQRYPFKGQGKGPSTLDSCY